jgi:2-dehydro-3-deoxyphosphogluconate aldolase / (4S)-4-hydroxy-2-oxoglutarate aldolase
MSRFSRIHVINTMMKAGIIPVFYHQEATTAQHVLKACYDGGIRVFEFTNRGDFAHVVFRELNKYAAAELPDMILGVGSVIEPGTASLYMQLGASFVVSPVLNEETGKVCNRRKVLWMPGCGSVSEISRAEELGAEIVKIFPATQVGGPAFIEAVKGPMPWTNIMPTGGVEPTDESLKAWFGAGAALVGMGSQLLKKSWIEQGNFSQISSACQAALVLAGKYKKQ